MEEKKMNRRFVTAVVVVREVITLAEVAVYGTGYNKPGTYYALKKLLRGVRRLECPAGMADLLDAAEIKLFKAIDALMAYETISIEGNDSERLEYFWKEFRANTLEANKELEAIFKQYYKS